MSGDFLAAMASSSEARVAAARAQAPEPELLARALASPVPPRLRLSPAGFDIIAEVKLRSPAAGVLQGGDEDVAARACAYAAGGAAAVSVLTEPSRFDGSLQHLQQVTRALARSAPAMRKDFLVEPYQVIEARCAGAGGVLAILRMIPVDATRALLDMAARLGLFVLLEAFDAADIELATQLLDTHGAAARAAAAPLLVGINCRDLVTLQVVPGRLETLARQLPPQAPRVAESGLESAADAARLAGAGYTLALVGSALMRAAAPEHLLGDMLRAGRAAASSAGSITGSVA
jgi:indole-3-glycerol phosphate synthase